MKINNITQLIELAKTGNTTAEVQLAYEYTKGQNIAKDLVKAFKLYELAAYEGNLTALFNLAQFYLNGIADVNGKPIIAKNPQMAISLLTQCANSGDLEAHYFLGLEYQKSPNLNYALAIERLEYCAQHELGKAQYELALIYLTIQPDLAKAKILLNKALTHKIVGAQELLDSLNS